MKLTARQQCVLNVILKHIKKTGIPPSRLDIQKAMGFQSPNSVTCHLNALAEKGVIKLTPKIARGIRVA